MLFAVVMGLRIFSKSFTCRGGFMLHKKNDRNTATLLFFRDLVKQQFVQYLFCPYPYREEYTRRITRECTFQDMKIEKLQFQLCFLSQLFLSILRGSANSRRSCQQPSQMCCDRWRKCSPYFHFRFFGKSD